MPQSSRITGAAGGPSGRAGQPFIEDRSTRKRRAVVEAATSLFLRHGYLGTSMDQIAALAAVSKPTVYKFFADKERLFTEIVLGTLDRAGDPFRAEVASGQNALGGWTGLIPFGGMALVIVLTAVGVWPRLSQYR